MKFKVIAEPDLSVFGSHPVITETLARIAESTVEHVTVEMHKMLTIAMESAIVAITASAMKHVSLQMEHTVHDVVGHATASPSATEADYLHLIHGFPYGGGVYAPGGGYGPGGGSGYGPGEGVAVGGYAGGVYGIKGDAAYSAQSASVSTGSISTLQSLSRSESYASKTSTAASATTAKVVEAGVASART